MSVQDDGVFQLGVNGFFIFCGMFFLEVFLATGLYVQFLNVSQSIQANFLSCIGSSITYPFPHSLQTGLSNIFLAFFFKYSIILYITHIINMQPESHILNKIFHIVHKKLYFVISEAAPQTKQDALYFNIDDELCYEPYNEDFGPINICSIYKFVKQLAQLLEKPQREKLPIFFHSGVKKVNYINAILFVCSYLVLHEKKRPKDAFQMFSKYEITPFRDIDTKKCLYQCTIMDCLRALHIAVKIGWFSMDSFNADQYSTYSCQDYGNISQIIPNKLFIFKQPPTNRINQYGNSQLTYKDYLNIFKQLKITKIIDLGDKPISHKDTQKMLLDQNIKYTQVVVKDGKLSRAVADIFVQEIEGMENGERVGVSCSDGLGKSCTMAGCFAIKHCLLDVREYIAWARMVRPGAIIGTQQFFLLDYQDQLRKSGETSSIRLKVSRKIQLNAEHERENTKQKSKNKRNSSLHRRSSSLSKLQKSSKPKKLPLNPAYLLSQRIPH